MTTTTTKDTTPSILQFDQVEQELGISTYLSSSSITTGFAGISKARYSDFIVREVGLNGKEATLLEQQEEEEKDEEDEEKKKNEMMTTKEEEMTGDGNEKKRKRNEEEQETTTDSSTKDDIWKQEFINQLTPLLPTTDEKTPPQQVVENVINMLSFWEEEESSKKKDTTTEQQHHNKKKKKEDDDDDEQKLNESPSVRQQQQPKYISLPSIVDKQKRRSIHELLKNNFLFSNICCADTKEGGIIRIWHVSFKSQINQYGQSSQNNRGSSSSSGNHNNKKKKKKPLKKKKEPWPTDKPPYLQFVLYKENIDTSVAIKDLKRTVVQHGNNNNNNPLGYAGMKDKRGITTQFVTMKHGEPIDFKKWWCRRQSADVDSSGGGSSTRRGRAVIRVGSFQYVEEELVLGRLLGNSFELVLRNVCVDSTDTTTTTTTGTTTSVSTTTIQESKYERTTLVLQNAMDALQKYGFINYFGMQRFGKYHNTHITGRLVLMGEFKKACESIMEKKGDEKDENERIKQARIKFQNRFHEIRKEEEKEEEKSSNSSKQQEELSRTNKMKKLESKICKSMIKDMGRFATAEIAILKSLQHYPLNYERAFLHGIPRNLRTMFFHANQSYLFNKLASYRIKRYGKDHVVEGDLVLLPNDDDTTKTTTQTAKDRESRVHIVTKLDVEQNKFDITHVVLPLMGSKVVLPKNDVGIELERILKDELKLSKQCYVKRHIHGDYRKLICKPTNVTWKQVQYSKPLQPLLETDLMKLQKEKKEEKNDSREQNEGEQNGTTPKEDMKQHVNGNAEAGITTTTTKSASDTPTTPATTTTTSMDIDDSTIKTMDGTTKETVETLKAEETNNNSMTAMILKFTLPPSAYATICLRELMKRPTSSEYQRLLQLTGPCEGALLESSSRTTNPASTSTSS